VAAPTSVRVEATSISTTVIRWSYAGSNQIGVWRSTDGVSYSEITASPPTRVDVGTTSYTDTGLTTATKYWYKLSDDTGSTFSSVVTVYTHACLDSPDGSDSFSLPRTGGGDPTEEFNELAKRVEEVLGARVLEPQQCSTCPVDGAVVLNCASGCHDWVVIADEDINSISMQWCDNGVATVEFLIPPNTTRRICGFASGFGFTGDECTQAPIVAGANGRSVTVSTAPATGGKASPSSTKSTPGTNTGPGTGGSSGGGCNCVPGVNGALTIKSCNANNSLACSGSKSLSLVACGGRGPYTWTNTGSVSLSRTSGASTTVTPSTNSGSAVAGNAYAIGTWHRCNGGFNQTHRVAYGCNDQVTEALASTISNGAFLTAAPACEANLMAADFPIPTIDHSNSSCSPNCDGCPNPTLDISRPSGPCDMRSGAMITAGCNPCGLQGGSTVTVTDALGTQATIILQV
jgi:hypothetical protein